MKDLIPRDETRQVECSLLQFRPPSATLPARYLPATRYAECVEAFATINRIRVVLADPFGNLLRHCSTFARGVVVLTGKIDN
jgi:hypothetical protein